MICKCVHYKHSRQVNIRCNVFLVLHKRILKTFLDKGHNSSEMEKYHVPIRDFSSATNIRKLTQTQHLADLFNSLKLNYILTNTAQVT